ncbi:MAG: hypothetical protein HY350_03155 [Candidatus Omnitrophica bacterium]|nr:hypothetical protein [Candidatus Omnitrophota bacterium]
MSNLLAGYGEKIITPQIGTGLTGYGYYLDRKTESILDDLKTRVLSLEKGKEKILLISCDLLGFTIEFTDIIRKEISKEYNLPLKNILIACTHTHSGPSSQTLSALGEIEPSYLESVKKYIKQAVYNAESDKKPSEFCFTTEFIEPIGYNRRNKSFEPVDSSLNIAVFKRAKNKIYLLNYACHPVTLGRTKEVSSDWPGAVAREVEKSGSKCVFFQGFCGDIDPVTNRNRWGKGTREDLAFYGKMLCQRAFKAEKYASPAKETTLNGVEKRIRLTLTLPQRNEEIEKEKKFWIKHYKAFPAVKRFFEEWAKEAKRNLASLQEKPYLENIPIQRIAIGRLKIMGLPGEIFCEYGLRLKERHSPLFTFGQSGGNIGYIPVKNTYKITDDYACYLAPKFYTIFPFSPSIENTIMKASDEIITGG